MNKLIDIHAHIIPGVDDGSRDMEMSLAMLRSAAEQGVTAVFAASHSFAYDHAPVRTREKYLELLECVKQAGIPVRIFPGMEMFCQSQTIDQCIRKLNSGVYPTLNGTRFVLTEFDVWEGAERDSAECVRRLTAEGFIPIIAHAERYPFVNAGSAERLKRSGALIQINVYSIEEARSGVKYVARELLDRGLADILGSDTHRTDHRPPAIKRGMDYLYQHYDRCYADAISWKNAEKWLIDG